MEVIQVRAAQYGLGVLADDVVDDLLVGLHAPDVILQRRPGLRALIRLKAQQRVDAFLAQRIGRDALFEIPAELLPESVVLFGIVFGQRLEFFHHLARDDLLQLGHQSHGLHGLTRDIERQVLRVDHALHEAQIVGQQVLVVLVDQDVARIQFQAILFAQGEDAALALAWDEQQRVQLHGRIGRDVYAQQRVIEVQRQLMVEILVLFVGHFLPGGAPQRGLFVDLLLVRADVDGEADVIRVFVDDVLEVVFLGEFGGILLEFDLDLRAALGHLGGADLVVVLARGVPGHGLGARLVGARGDPHPFGDHEHGVEAHAELPDDLGEIHFLVPGGFDEFARTRLGDGTQVFHDLVAGHADARVLDGQGAGFFVGVDADSQFRVGIEHVAVGQHLEADAVKGVRSVREQFAQEDLAVLVERVDQNVEQLPGLGLEQVGLRLVARWGGVGHGGSS